MSNPIGHTEDYVSLVVQQIATERSSGYLRLPTRSEHEVRNGKVPNNVVCLERYRKPVHRLMAEDQDQGLSYTDWSSDHGQGQF